MAKLIWAIAAATTVALSTTAVVAYDTIKNKNNSSNKANNEAKENKVLKEKISKIEKEMVKSKYAYAYKALLNNKLNSELKISKDKLNELTNSLAKLTKDEEKLKSEITELKKDKEKNSAELESKINELESINKEKIEAIRKLDNLTKTNSQLEDEVNKLILELEEASDSEEAMETYLDAYKLTYNKLNKKYVELLNEINGKNDAVARTLEELNKVTDELTNLKSVNQNKQLIAEIEALRQQLNNTDSRKKITDVINPRDGKYSMKIDKNNRTYSNIINKFLEEKKELKDTYKLDVKNIYVSNLTEKSATIDIIGSQLITGRLIVEFTE
ncbi:Hypothetical protein, predicted transmembrane protein [Metamycoplasma auris 15026]|uniref:Uncharacterized protein n=1 Tax=Metamycoplasma auris 15026 TaxID=1188233 RepID=N9TRG6_9BACT|nr:hypothetical protein [Metamycoplasma auris]ENY68754.1 Hypothetical protein, predicted transmembrane protein [Metamycoplasma auris 15026]